MLDLRKENFIHNFEQNFNLSLFSFQKDMIRCEDSRVFCKQPFRAGKTFGLCALALYQAVVNNNNVIVCSTNRYCAERTLLCVTDIISSSGKTDIISKSRRRPMQELVFTNGKRIRFLVGDSFDLHGQEADVICADNYDLYSEESINKGIIPMLYCGKDIRLMATGVGINNVVFGWHIRT